MVANRFFQKKQKRYVEMQHKKVHSKKQIFFPYAHNIKTDKLVSCLKVLFSVF